MRLSFYNFQMIPVIGFRIVNCRNIDFLFSYKELNLFCQPNGIEHLYLPILIKFNC